jgi:hypothetical protein
MTLQVENAATIAARAAAEAKERAARAADPDSDDFIAKGFKVLGAGLPANVARSIKQRVAIFMKEETPERFQKYVQEARLTHAMIEDYKARTAEDPDDRKKAAETFLKLTEALAPRKKARR